ncbi:MAG: hypothetical protein K0S46_810 [Moraxellaceae bacterium]|jgi:hypothetical protein|nr:hypothetical protein [Moraxellaceae bacterium]
MMKKALLATAIAALSVSSYAMEAMDEEALASTTGQDGLTVTITPPGAGISADIIWHDIGGYTGAATSGAVVIGDPNNSATTGTHDSFRIVATGGIVLDIDASGSVNGAPGLKVGVSLPTGMVLTTGDISVAATSGTPAYTLTNQSADILNSMTITFGSGSLASINLGSEPLSGAMIMVNTSLTSGLNIANFALNDANSSGSLNAVSIAVDDNGAGTNLTTAINIDATSTGLLATIGTLGSATGIDVTMVDVGLGSTTSMGDVQIKGLNLVGTTIRIAGH